MPPPLAQAIAKALRRPCAASLPIAACGGLMIPDVGSIMDNEGAMNVCWLLGYGGGGRGWNVWKLGACWVVGVGV